MEETMTDNITVKKRNGNTQELDLEKIHSMVDAACKDLPGVSASQVEMTSGLQFYDGISTDEIQEILIKSASDLISLDHPNYQYVAARLLLFSIRKKIYGGRIDLPHLNEHIRRCVDLGVYDSVIYDNYTEEELNEANSFIDHDRDLLFTYAAMKELVDKYLVQNRKTKELYETPQFMYMMVALTSFANYPKETRLSYVKRFYDSASRYKINVPTPILAGVRTQKRQYSSCTLLDCGDSMESIIATTSAMFRYVSNKAGIGLNVGRIRGLGSEIRDGEVVHTGVVPFIKAFEGVMNSCSQGGLRKGSATLFFPIWHQEIRELIVLKNEKGNDENRARSLDYAVSTSRLFYERFINNQKITLFSPHDVPGLYDAFGSEEFDELYVRYENDDSIPKEVVDAQELTLEILTERSDTGRLYILNIDHANSHSPYKSIVRMSNLCVAGDTEIFINYVDIERNRTKYEYVKIKDLWDYLTPKYKDVKVLSYDIDRKKVATSRIIAFAQTSPSSKVIKITDTTSNNSIVLTPDHKVYTTNRGYVEAKDLNPNDQLEVYTYTYDDRSNLKIEHLEEEIPVYDITVEGTHNFFANDILIHNCMEIALLTEPIGHIDDTNGAIALCILSALNVGTLKSEKELEEHCDIIVRQLDELIDIQEYPVKAAELSARKYRPLGVGIIGLAHYLARNSVKYDDPEAVNLVHRLAESIQYYLLKASNQLAREKGPCEGFSETKYSEGILPIDTYKKSIDDFCSEPLQHDWESLRKDIVKYGLRNTTLTAAMPSEASSKLSNTTNGIEPPRGYLSIKRKAKIIVPQYNKLKNNYTLAWDMKSNEGYFNIVAVIQKFFDQAISANWYYNPEHYPDNKVPMSVIVRDFLSSFQKGHKTAYYNNTYDRNEENMELESLVNEILEQGEEDCESCKL